MPHPEDLKNTPDLKERFKQLLAKILNLGLNLYRQSAQYMDYKLLASAILTCLEEPEKRREVLKFIMSTPITEVGDESYYRIETNMFSPVSDEDLEGMGLSRCVWIEPKDWEKFCEELSK